MDAQTRFHTAQKTSSGLQSGSLIPLKIAPEIPLYTHIRSIL